MVGIKQSVKISELFSETALVVLQLYVLNTDTFLGRKKVTDRLFDSQSGQ